MKRHAFSLQLTERCNMACVYCYVRRRRKPDQLDCSPDFCEQFIDFTLRESKDRVKITFFGGEPLLRSDLIRHTVAYGKKAAAGNGAKAIEFHLVTNGTLLDDETGDFIAGEGIGLEVSLDGPEPIHDLNRTYLDGSPSFRRVYGNLLRFVERHPDHPVSIFSVITSAESLPWLQALCRGLDVQSFTFNPVRPEPGNEHRTDCHRTTMRALQSRIDRHQEAFLSGDTDFDEGINAQMACLIGSHAPPHCEAGANATIVTRTGDIYPCAFFVGHEDQVIGSITQGFYPEKAKPYVERFLAGLKPCRQCRARRICGSGCAFDAYEQTGRVDIPTRDACLDTRKYVRHLEASLVTIASREPERLIQKTDTLEHAQPAAAIGGQEIAAIRNFVIRLTGQCNLACDYCYEKGTGLAGDHLDYPTARSIAKHILEDSVLEPLVCLFGGEPLLNWEVGEFLIEEIARGAEQLGKRPFFHVTTNGTLISPEIARTIARHRVTVQVSVDGTKERHDRHRKYRDGSGSYEAMLRGVELLKRADPEARIDGQVVLYPGSTDLVAISAHLKAMGFRRISYLVAGWEKRTGLDWSDDDILALTRARENFFPFFLDSALSGHPEVDMGFAGLLAMEPDGPMGLCECGTGEVYIDTQAQIHRCPQLYTAGHPSIGRCGQQVYEGRLDLPVIKTVDEDCLACWAYPRCRGGCIVRNQRCPWIPSLLLPGKRKLWCEFMRAEFSRAMLAYRILESRRPESIQTLKALFSG
ncbi:MAG: radical SAM protein [Nitrospirota bacterium]|nr:radical SAM protein [Nitrospirota bacterium]